MTDPRPGPPGAPQPDADPAAAFEAVDAVHAGAGPDGVRTPQDGAVRAAPTTSDAGVDQALAQLRAAVDSPLEHQVEAYVGAHRALQDRLADLDG
jgi:hypothetical protein